MEKEKSYGVWRKREDEAIKQYPDNKGGKCIDCGITTRYFNQCMDCNEKMLSQARAMD